ncbi:MAG: hypothetical protein KDA89_11020, partial [Planctomycetaceae bacterium]|nr:hypothetical protein [Planctomycetaceae bacterium]
MCSGLPGFLRGVGAQLAGKCRLLECYSLSEAAQMVQLHRPGMALIDLRRASPQQFDRTWAMAQNSPSTTLIVVTDVGGLSDAMIPPEVSGRVISVETDRNDGELTVVADAVRNARPGRRSGTAAGDTEAADQAASIADVPETRRFGSAHEAPMIRRNPSGPAVANAGQEFSGNSNGTRSSPPRIIADSADGIRGTSGEIPPIAERYRTRTPGLRQMLERLEVAARH